MKRFGYHKNVFSEGELNRWVIVAKFATVQKEGDREAEREIDFYNLDIIISVGYRVKSQRDVQFRIWAANVLKEYMIKGFAMGDCVRQLDMVLSSGNRNCLRCRLCHPRTRSG